MLHMLIFYVADVVFECCMDRPMGDVPIGHPGASSADINKDGKTYKVRKTLL